MSRLVRRSMVENLVRRRWGARPEPISWLLSGLYGGVMDIRNAIWTLGLARPNQAAVPVVSVGGLTTGGSGKTPVTAYLARYLADCGVRVAVLTPGQSDEIQFHASANPDVPVFGGRNRSRLVERVVEDGAAMVLLDSGFQHRRLARDLDVVTILVDSSSGLKRLPAGPSRERWAALGRAHSVVLVRRHAPKRAGERMEGLIREAFPAIHVAHVSIKAGTIAPVSPGAMSAPTSDPQLAVAGVMWPELFFADVARAGLSPDHELCLADHIAPDGRTVALITELAGSRGIVCTPKDAGKLAAALPDELPIWRIDESITWGPGGQTLLCGIRGLVRQDAFGSHNAA